ncbi:enhancer of mRNA decapping [Orbilia ellipsospora]|uniref:Enhancer of mRNA-decapping protein 3 n=1 Tax=Orbilia ellipsospora TaxID=2528407 RepID=A0AAV9X1Q9_9PEZI
MASQFIGCTVRVTLKSGQVLQGVVASLEGQTLVISNGFDVTNNISIPYPFSRIDGPVIAELEVLDDGPSASPVNAIPQPPPPQQSFYSADSAPPPLPPQAPVVNTPPIGQTPPQFLPHFPPPPPVPYNFQAPPPQAPSHISPITPSAPTAISPAIAAGVQQPKKKPFVDPAIVSVGRPSAIAPPKPTRESPLKEFLPPAPPAIAFPAPPVLKLPSGPPTAVQTTPTGPTKSHQNTKEKTITVTRPPFTTPALTSPFSKLKLGDAVDSSAFEETDDPSQASFHVSKRQTDNRARRGRRQSDASSFGNRQSYTRNNGNISQQRRQDNYGARRRHRHQNSNTRDEDGWATEDVNDIKDHEFDFQGNLERFDKKTVFSQIEAEDTTAAEDRLVSFNKRPQNNADVPSIRKNFKNSENVLGTYANGAALADRETWNDNSFLKKSTEIDSSSSDDEEEAGSRSSSRRGMTRPNRHGASSKLLRKASVNVSGRISPNISSGIGSGGGRAEQLTNSGDAKVKPILRLKTSSRPCPVVSPLQMLDVERIAEVDLGLTDDMMTENAGRGLAQVAIQAFGKRLHSGNHNSLPVVLVFAGNNKSGARAVAAGRHLKNHHVRVLICVLGLEREEELIDHLRRQIQIFRNAGGRLAHWNELSYKLQSLDSPPELIIDGLLGMHVAFEDLRLPDQASLFELVKFANTSKAHIMSIDVPSGIDGQTGEITTLDDAEPFYVKAKFVVCMGAPKTGVRAALQTVGAGWNLHVVDIGIPNTAWRKYGSRRRHGVEFGAEWVSAIEYIL